MILNFGSRFSRARIWDESGMTRRSLVHTQKMAELLELPKDKTEQFSSDPVSNKTISVKLDRLQHMVTFQQKAITTRNS